MSRLSLVSNGMVAEGLCAVVRRSGPSGRHHVFLYDGAGIRQWLGLHHTARRTLKGRAYNALGWGFSGYCTYKMVSSVRSILRRHARPGTDQFLKDMRDAG